MNLDLDACPRQRVHVADALDCQSTCVHKSRIMHKNDRAVFIGLALCIIYVLNASMKYGYARVSTDAQSVAAQVEQLTQAGAEKVFREKASGAKTDRAQFRKALDALNEGDVLLVTRLDRLARSTRDLLNTLATITADKLFLKLGQPRQDGEHHASARERKPAFLSSLTPRRRYGTNENLYV